MADRSGQIILPIIYPDFLYASQTVNIAPTEIVLGVKVDGQYRAYPVTVMRWHEVVNDNIDNHHFSAIYCPLTAAGMAWDREDSMTLGTANLVYNSGHVVNIFSVDNFWLPMTQQCIYGPRITELTDNLPYIEITWQNWKQMYPNSRVLAREQGFQYDYDNDPYPQYSVDDGMILYPTNNQDNRLQAKDKVYTILFDGHAKAYPITLFADSIGLISDTIDGQPVVIAGSRDKQLFVSFYRVLDDSTPLAFEPIKNSLPAILSDNRGNTWDVFGSALSGPDAGSQLQACRAYSAYWFAVAAVYPDIEIYQTQ